MNDLLTKTFSRPRDDLESGNVGVEMQNADQGTMQGFFDEVSVIKSDMEVIQQLLIKLQEANEESKTIHKAAAMKALRDRMDHDVKEVTRQARVIKAKLEDLDKKNEASRKITGSEEGSPTDRTRVTITNSLLQKLKDYMEEFSNLRNKMVAEYKEVIERRYFTVTGTQPDEKTLDHIIDTGESETFMQKAIQEQGRGQVIETIKEIQERHDGVKEIEKSLLELQQIFSDMQVLVATQGDQINDIESNVNRAQSYVERAATQLHVAKRLQRNTRCWILLAFILLIIIAAVIVIPILKSTGVI